MLKKTFLVEIGVEELPPKSLRDLAEAFFSSVVNLLKNAGLSHDKVSWFAAPRRLALKVTNLSMFQVDRLIEKRGPAISLAFDEEGKPSKVAEAWAHSCGISVDQADRLVTRKGEWLLYRVHLKGVRAETLLPNIVETALLNLPIPSRMRWGKAKFYFIRPVRTMTLLLDDTVIPTTILGVVSDRVIRGNRFIGEQEFVIKNANQYPQILVERGKVIADYEQRKARIKADVEEAACKIGGNADLSNDLLEEVTSLVDWPVVLIAKFEEKFLKVPIEVLVHILKDHQKCFPVYSKDGKLLPKFIFVSNIESKNLTKIVSGNEKVVHSRLSDAEFFFNTDRKRRLEDNLPYLQTVLFHRQLGTLRDKTDRIVELSDWIARKIGANVQYARRASLLSKCDLVTSMVCEFTDTQGIMGMYYARYDGENEEIAVAINEQYQPRFSGEDLPSNQVSCAVAIADKMDTLTGIIGIGQRIKSNKDPFALRRAAIGILRIIIKNNLKLDLQTLAEETARLYGTALTNTKVADDVVSFILCRFRTWYQDQGYSIDTIQSVLARRPTCPSDFDARIKAVTKFRSFKEASSLAIMNKRVSNILKKISDPMSKVIYFPILKEEAEVKLARNLVLLHNKLQLYFKERRYSEALIELSSLRREIEDFFQHIMVDVNDEVVRVSRLMLLSKVHDLFLQVADLSLLKQ